MKVNGINRHGKGTHALIGVGAAMIGGMLGVAVVYLDSISNQQLEVQAVGIAACPTGDYGCDYRDNAEIQKGRNCKKNTPCQDTTNGHTCTGVCLSNTDKCQTVKCDGKGLDGKPKEMPKDMGGMPPMLPMLPMPMPKMPMPMPPEKDDCTQTPKPASCPNTGISNLLGNIFGTTSAISTAGGAVQSGIQSVTDKLTSFLKGDTSNSAAVTTNANANATVNNPTQAVVTPVIVSGSNAGQVTSQGSAQATLNGSTQAGGLTNPSVTGFGGGASADVDTSTGPILSAMRSIVSKIQSLLSSIF
jgi:hypothetical protein